LINRYGFYVVVKNTLILIPRNKVVYSFSSKHKPVEEAVPGDIVVFETQDALGGQVVDESTSLESIDWSKVNPATGPLYVKGARPGDTLVVDILDIRVEDKAIVVVVPGHGALYDKEYSAKAKVLRVTRDWVEFGRLLVGSRPMIGVIGVAPREGEVPTGSLGSHGGNMDVALITRGSTLYLPVYVDGALLAIGDLHAVQSDGELCVSAAEVPGEVTVRVGVIKGVQPSYPVLDAGDKYAILAYGETLDEAAYRASEAAVKALAKEHGMSFEEAYMLGSLVVDLRINQVVDPLKGVRAEIPKRYVSLNSLLST